MKLRLNNQSEAKRREGGGQRHVAPPLGDWGGGRPPWLLISLVFGVEWYEF